MQITYNKKPSHTVADAKDLRCQFIFDNHLYCVVAKDNCKDCRITWQNSQAAACVLCFNLKSHTFRCLPRHAEVKLVDCTVDVQEFRSRRNGPSNFELET